MATITDPYTWVDGDPITAATQNTRFSTLYTAINGNIEDVNIKTAANIALSKLNLTTELLVKRALANMCISAGVTGDTVGRVSLSSSGLVQFGPGSASAQDMAIKREDANTLAVRDAGDTTYKNFKADTLTLATALSYANGGTGQSTYAAGDLIYASAINVLSKLPAGTNGNALVLAAGLPSWGTLGIASGAVGFTGYAAGDIIYASALNTLAKLAAGTNGQVLTLALGLPSWASVTAGSFTISAQNSSFTASGASNTYYRITAASAITVSMPASPADGRVLKFKRVSGTALITFTPNGSEFIDSGDGIQTASAPMTYDNYGVIEMIAVTGGWEVS